MMDGVFGTGLSFSQFIISLLIIFAGAIAFKISFNFDVNEYLKERQKRYKAKIQNACLHFEFIKDEDGQVKAKLFFVSPPGTLNHICQRCGLVRMHIDEQELQRTIDFYAKDIRAYKKENGKFYKLLKKSGNV